MSTGAFEVTLNGKTNALCFHTFLYPCFLLLPLINVDIPIWSKLQSGRVPEPAEMFQILDGQMKLSHPTPDMDFRSMDFDGAN